MFNLAGLSTPARVVSTHDGDTLRAVFKFAGDYKQFIVRLAHVDAPEISSKDACEKSAAVRSRNRVLQLVCPDGGFELAGDYTCKEIEARLQRTPAIVTLECGGWDKYARLLARVTTWQHLDVAKVLLREGLGRPYEGGTKEKFLVDAAPHGG